MATAQEIIESRRSWVRVWVTYAATFYAFAGALGLIIGLWFADAAPAALDDIKDIFLTVLPVATGVITYWFATRQPSESKPSETHRSLDENVQENTNDGGAEGEHQPAAHAQQQFPHDDQSPTQAQR